MNSQLYTAASGLITESRRVELISNNLANAATHGYRAQRAFNRLFQGLAGEVRPTAVAANKAVVLGGSYETPGPGPVHETAGGLDLALEDRTFLVVETPAGRRYTRVGALAVSAEDELVDLEGRRVLGSGGEPVVGLRRGPSIGSDASVFERVEGREEQRGRLLVVRDPAGVLRPEGNGLLTADGRDGRLETVERPRVRPGWLEGSTTDAVGELLRMIESQRAFETYQRLVTTTMNEVNRRIINEVAG